jgi:ribonucleotide monophosphatase NagD (HAD superfamily)
MKCRGDYAARPPRVPLGLLYVLLLLQAPALLVAAAECGAAGARVPGVALDLDGVVRQGDRPCLEGLAAVVALQRLGYPFVFMTNGGMGRSEAQYAAKLERMLRSEKVARCFVAADGATNRPDAAATNVTALQRELLPLRGSQFVLAYSPLQHSKDTLPLKNQTVLVVGAAGTVRVARAYGFSRAVHANEWARRHDRTGVDPWNSRWVSKIAPGCPSMFGDEAAGAGDDPAFVWDAGRNSDVGGILVMSDPNHWGQALQLCVDFLLSSNPVRAELEPVQPPIHFANPDFLWKSEFPRPRFALGAFKTALRAVYHQRLRGLGLDADQIAARERDRWYQIGKPFVSQYRFAEQRLDEQSACIGPFVMVGDNHNTDIKGATAAAAAAAREGRRRTWKSVLVRTGVWQEGQPTEGATVVLDHAAQALAWIEALSDGHRSITAEL